ncbi:hypothetical protein Emed_001424 [Eimeria media]
MYTGELPAPAASGGAAVATAAALASDTTEIGRVRHSTPVGEKVDWLSLEAEAGSLYAGPVRVLYQRQQQQ